jgi:hypothetical protein
MIAYDLCCENGHTFEGWFESARSFERQQKKGQVSCPVCDSTAIARIPSTFGIRSGAQTPPTEALSATAEALGRRIHEFVDKNFDNVGPDFAKEALKIHYGASEPRNIRGVSTPVEEKTLRDEGVDFFKIPLPSKADPDD